MTVWVPSVGFAAITGLAAFVLAHSSGVITGDVRDELGQPIVGAQVTIDRLCGAISGTRGQFTLTSVPAGRYYLRAAFPDFVTYQDSVTITAGDTLRLSLALVPTRSRQERDSVRARIEAILTTSPEPPVAAEWWIGDCK